jgi:hypothetical protein
MALFVGAMSFADQSIWGVVFHGSIRFGALPLRFDPFGGASLWFGLLGALSLQFDPFGGVSLRLGKD